MIYITLMKLLNQKYDKICFYAWFILWSIAVIIFFSYGYNLFCNPPDYDYVFINGHIEKKPHFDLLFCIMESCFMIGVIFFLKIMGVPRPGDAIKYFYKHAKNKYNFYRNRKI